MVWVVSSWVDVIDWCNKWPISLDELEKMSIDEKVKYTKEKIVDYMNSDHVKQLYENYFKANWHKNDYKEIAENVRKWDIEKFLNIKYEIGWVDSDLSLWHYDVRTKKVHLEHDSSIFTIAHEFYHWLEFNTILVKMINDKTDMFQFDETLKLKDFVDFDEFIDEILVKKYEKLKKYKKNLDGFKQSKQFYMDLLKQNIYDTEKDIEDAKIMLEKLKKNMVYKIFKPKMYKYQLNHYEEYIKAEEIILDEYKKDIEDWFKQDDELIENYEWLIKSEENLIIKLEEYKQSQNILKEIKVFTPEEIRARIMELRFACMILLWKNMWESITKEDLEKLLKMKKYWWEQDYSYDLLEYFYSVDNDLFDLSQEINNETDNDKKLELLDKKAELETEREEEVKLLLELLNSEEIWNWIVWNWNVWNWNVISTSNIG